jgi:hypothetical protein
VYGSASGSVRAVRTTVCGSALGSACQCVRQCAAVRLDAAVRHYAIVRQCATVCGSVRA